MGDGVGNLEEQIRCVGEQIRRVEEQIDRCPDDEERKLLLGKEAQLRVEKAQLREQILQGRDLGTEYEWLVQKVVAPAPYSGARIYPSSSNQNRMWIPVKVEHWDVRGNIEEFLSSADKKKRVHNLDITRITGNIETVEKEDVYMVHSILKEMRTFMNKKEPLSKFSVKPQLRMLTMKRGKNDEVGLGEGATANGMIDVYTRGPIADFVVTLGEKNGLVVEVKNGGLGPDQGGSWDLHKAWAECTCKQGEGDLICSCKVFGITPACREKVMRCIN
ncbi:uncharacterized protein [Physcomitrium patens]|uniref:uncharacterized protein n=1 Tax=Physcomitrium patens TaxID=3218 RepID=UPI000D15C294|nr:uncharacterized protein LOC112272750 isoform X1 [Physcomitrium patens]XP_024356592.1 uncharacterized protein LOC112272750 isoform X1 [Physcomitrium patens]XP_024356593.1 uncharacterized protein LOC112272750 isoform X1 [Physcomitrium patens]|eukprot:XP_024356590.1 uncharacterized protein LOC112272750 isoform X1 [Physcomitrella patens]